MLKEVEKSKKITKFSLTLLNDSTTVQFSMNLEWLEYFNLKHC